MNGSEVIVISRTPSADSTRSASLSLSCARAISAVYSGDSLDTVGSELEDEFPDVDVATEFGVMLRRWFEDQVISI